MAHEQGLLPRNKTPKQAWVERYLLEPIEVYRPTRSHLLKVAGSGPRSADRISAVRQALVFSRLV
jgi:predicted DNA-binding helix-hairpin-helix protein